MIYLRKFFKLDERNATIKKEIIGGLSTFLAMAYILAVNPALVGSSALEPGTSNSAMIYSGGLFLATALSAFIGTLLMGLYANLPIGLAPGMGLNAFFAYNVSSSIGFESALTVTMISGVLYFIVVMTPARNYITKKIPKNLKIAIGAALGFFIAYLGLQNAGLIQKGPALVSGFGDLSNPAVILAFILLFIGLVLYYLKIPGSIVITMLIGALLYIILKYSSVDILKDGQIWNSNPYAGFDTFSSVVSAGWKGFANGKMWTSPMTYFGILCFLYMDFFDTTGTLMSLDRMIDLDKKDPKWMSKANFVDAFATVSGASIGSTTVTSFVESLVGVASGAKTGLSNVITAFAFALAIPAFPLMQVFMPINVFQNGTLTASYQPITGPILIIIGTLMITQLRYFEWDITIDIPVLFLTILFMMLTNSIAEGIGIGIISFVILNLFCGLYQLIRNKKRVVENLSMPMAEDIKEIKSKEFYYLKRLNLALILTSLVALTYMIISIFA